MKTIGYAGVLLASCLCAVGCTGGQEPATYSIASRADARQGKRVIETAGCGACHIIPGIRQARGLVGPPLLLFGRRTMIAGELPNSPGNLQRWLRDPKSVEPGTAMPDLGLTEEEAWDVTAYLYTLR